MQTTQKSILSHLLLFKLFYCCCGKKLDKPSRGFWTGPRKKVFAFCLFDYQSVEYFILYLTTIQKYLWYFLCACVYGKWLTMSGWQTKRKGQKAWKRENFKSSSLNKADWAGSDLFIFRSNIKVVAGSCKFCVRKLFLLSARKYISVSSDLFLLCVEGDQRGAAHR